MQKQKNRFTQEAIQKNKIQKKDRFVFYFTVSITGAAVMMIELLGTRIIGPYYGVSLIVWSSLISVALIALSMGYFLGGKFADHSNWIRLSHIVLLAAFWTGLIPNFSESVQLATDFMGLRAGAFSSALILFGPPLVLLGMVGPFVIKMAARRLEEIGSTAGNIYAISTLGSVAGTLLLGFFLLPLVGTRAIILSLSLVLIGLSLFLAFYEQKRLLVNISTLHWVLVCGLVSLLLLALDFERGEKQPRSYRLLSQAETHYGWVRVVEKKNSNVRWLMSDSSTIGAQDLRSGQSLLSYQRIVGLLPWFNLRGKEALLIGLGSGHLVATLDRYRVKTDAIEIDSAVVDAAKAFFNFKATGRVIVGDARYQIRKLTKTYDFIIHDCFTGGSEPIHLFSQEMMRQLQSRLKPGGILVINFLGFTEKEKQNPVESVARTLDSTFNYRRTFVSSPNKTFTDFVFFVSDQPLAIEQGAQQQNVKQWLEQHEIAVSGSKGFIITDDFNPLESLQLAKAEYYRDILIERVGKDVLFR